MKMNYHVWSEGLKTSGPNLQHCRALHEAIAGAHLPLGIRISESRVEIGMPNLVIRLREPLHPIFA